MNTIFGGQCAGLDFELLERIGKGEREVEIVERVVMHGPIEFIGGSKGRPSGNGETLSSVDPLPGTAGGGRSQDHRPRHRDQIRRVASVERQLQNSLIFEYLADAGGLRLHQRRRRIHLHRFSYVADL